MMIDTIQVPLTPDVHRTISVETVGEAQAQLTPHQALERACRIAGGQKALGDAIGTSQSNVWTWLNKSKKGAPAGYVLKIEQVTGVSRHDIRPDIYPREASQPARITLLAGARMS